MDTSLCVDSLLPHIVAHFEHVKKTFHQIDKLETAVKVVEKSVTSMEAELSTAETYLESESMFKTVFKPFLVTFTISCQFTCISSQISPFCDHLK